MRQVDNHRNYTVTLPDFILTSFGWNESETPSRIREALVMELLRMDRITEADAALALDLDRWALLDLMGTHQVPAVGITPEELATELSTSIEGSLRPQ